MARDQGRLINRVAAKNSATLAADEPLRSRLLHLHAWCFHDEATPITDSLFDQLPHDDIFVPDIWSVETINTLVTAERRKRIKPATIQHASIVIDHGCSRGFLSGVPSLARTHRLSAYDAACRELAHREKLPLATQCAHLQKAAKAVKVTLLT